MKERQYRKTNNKGITLVELIVALGLLSVVIVLAYTIFITGLRGYQRETTTTENQRTVRQVSSFIGREIRRASTVEVNHNKLYLTDPEGTVATYQLEGETITKNGSHLAEGIQLFEVTMNQHKVSLLIQSVGNSSGTSFSLLSEFAIRK